tara:strand:- start:352 stop:1407 length:1056 start_codon:yes stop_codon:yes gene_type:complete
MIKKIKIGKFVIGEGCPTFIVAELSGNHNGKLKNLLNLISLAKNSGANAIKIQSYTPDTITLKSNKNDFKIKKNNTWSKYKTLYELYEVAHTPFEWIDEIFSYCKKLNILIFSSVFDKKSLDVLERKKCNAYKIASNEITDIPLIEKVAKTNKPVMISTGLAEIKDIALIVKVFKKFNNKKLIILKCTSTYPTPFDQVNLLNMLDIKYKYNCLSGISDHSLGSKVPLVATALGASVIEKHFIKSSLTKSVDSFFSLNPKEFKKMTEDIRLVEKILGKNTYKIPDSSKINFAGRRSLYISKKIKKGERITRNNIKSVRPGFGLHPKFYKKVLGKKVNRDLFIGDRLSWKVII